MAKKGNLIDRAHFLSKNKAFLVSRCVWCGKTRVINLIGRFFGKNKAFLAPRCVWCGKTSLIIFIPCFF